MYGSEKKSLKASKRTFTSVYLTEKTLGNIYSVGVALINLNLSKCSIRSLPPNMFYYIPNLVTAGNCLVELQTIHQLHNHGEPEKAPTINYGILLVESAY